MTILKIRVLVWNNMWNMFLYGRQLFFFIIKQCFVCEVLRLDGIVGI